MVLPLWRGRGERLGLVHHVNPNEFQGLVVRDLGVMHRAGRNLVGSTGLQLLCRLAVDKKIGFAFQYIADLEARMGMSSGAPAGRDFGHRGHGGVTTRKFGLLQRRALDAALLGDGGACAGKSDDGQSEQKFPDHEFPPCGERLAGPGAREKRVRRTGRRPAPPVVSSPDPFKTRRDPKIMCIHAGTRPPKNGISARLSVCGRLEVKIISAPAWVTSL